MRGFDLASPEALVAQHMAEPTAPWSEDEHAALRATLHDLLSATATSVDDLVDRCQVSAAAINAILLEWELAGRINFLPGPRVALSAAEVSAPGQSGVAEPF